MITYLQNGVVFSDFMEFSFSITPAADIMGIFLAGVLSEYTLLPLN